MDWVFLQEYLWVICIRINFIIYTPFPNETAFLVTWSMFTCRSFQSPIEVPGVSNSDFLRLAANARRKQLGQEELGPLEFYGFVMPKARAGASTLLCLDTTARWECSGHGREATGTAQALCQGQLVHVKFYIR